MQTAEERKLFEAELPDELRDPALLDDPERHAKLTAHRKSYMIARRSRAFFSVG